MNNPSWNDLRGDRDAIRERFEALFHDGCRSVLLVGPPAAGLTLLARRLPELLGKVYGDEAAAIRLTRESYRIQTGQTPPALTFGRPWRAPHHSVSADALDTSARSEYSLATGGTLYLDDVARFNPWPVVHLVEAVGRRDPLGPRLVVGACYRPTHQGLFSVNRFEKSKRHLLTAFHAAVYLDRAAGADGNAGGLVLADPADAPAAEGLS